jgi:hypothetical protein
MKKKILFLISNAYAAQAIFEDLNYYFKKNHEVTIVIDNFFLDNHLKSFFKSKKAFILDVYSFKSRKKISDLNIILNSIKIYKKLNKLFFDEILVSDFYSYYIRFLIFKLKKNNTIVSFFYPHNLDLDTLSHFFYKNKLKKINFKFLIFSLKKKYLYDFKVKIIFIFLINFVLQLFFYKNFFFYSRSKKSLFKKNRYSYQSIIDNKLCRRVYYFNKIQEVIYKKICSNNVDLVHINQKPKISMLTTLKPSALFIPFPLFSKNIENCILIYKYHSLKQIKKIIKNNNIDTIIVKNHPRDESSYVTDYVIFLKNYFDVKIYHYKKSYLEKIYYYKILIVYGFSSLSFIISRRVGAKVFISKKIAELDFNKRFSKSFFNLIIENYGNFKNKQIILVD